MCLSIVYEAILLAATPIVEYDTVKPKLHSYLSGAVVEVAYTF